MSSSDELLQSIQSTPSGLSIADILARHPELARRTAQRWLNEWVSEGRIIALGAGRARRYSAALPAATPTHGEDIFPRHIPLSADSRDILAYIDQLLVARKPVGYRPRDRTMLS